MFSIGPKNFHTLTPLRLLFKKCEGYPLDPTKKGLVLHFYQSNDRDGWEEDLKAIEETFGDVLNCEIRNFKDFTDARLLTLLNDLQVSLSLSMYPRKKFL